MTDEISKDVQPEKTDYPYPGPIELPPAQVYDVESECHVELTCRRGGQQLIFRVEWPNDPTTDQTARTAAEAEILVELAKAYLQEV